MCVCVCVCVCVSIYTYIYIYVCVCVCVCVNKNNLYFSLYMYKCVCDCVHCSHVFMMIVSSKSILLHNSQWMPFLTEPWNFLNSFCTSLLDSLIMCVHFSHTISIYFLQNVVSIPRKHVAEFVIENTFICFYEWKTTSWYYSSDVYLLIYAFMYVYSEAAAFNITK